MSVSCWDVFPSDLAQGMRAPPSPPSLILPVFSPTLVLSFEILLRSKSVPSALRVYLWKFGRGTEADARACHTAGKSVPLPPPFSMDADRGNLASPALGPRFSPLQSLPVWRDSAFFTSPQPLLCSRLYFSAFISPASLTTGWLTIEFQGKKDPVLGVQTTYSLQCPAVSLALLPKFLDRLVYIWVDCSLSSVSWPWFLLLGSFTAVC